MLVDIGVHAGVGDGQAGTAVPQRASKTGHVCWSERGTLCLMLSLRGSGRVEPAGSMCGGTVSAFGRNLDLNQAFPVLIRRTGAVNRSTKEPREFVAILERSRTDNSSSSRASVLICS